MAYCCVPRCKSDEKKKTEGLSFHEVPVDIGLKEKWISAIRRDNWTPNSTSCYTKVCSRHFKGEDFIEGKRRRLRKGVVPSVFEDYPPYLQPKITNERSRASIAKRALSSDKLPINDRAAVTAASYSLSSAVPIPSQSEMDNLPIPMDTTADGNESADQHEGPDVAHETNRCDRGVQVGSKLPSSVIATEKAKWKRKERDLRSHRR